MPSKEFSKDFLKDPTRSLKLIEKEEENVAKLLDGVFKNIEKDIKNPARVHAYTPSGISFDILEAMKRSSDLHFDDIADDLSYMAEETATSGYTSGRAFGAVALGAKIEERQKEWKKLKIRIDRFDDEFKGMSAKLSKDVRRVISDGVVNEITQGEMISQIKKISDAGKTQAQTIVRTETMKAVNDGVLDRYEEDEVGIVEALTVDDERRCGVCGPLDGVKFPINDHPAFPIHPRCRCTWVPVAFDYDGDVMRWSEMDEDSTKADYRPWSPDNILTDYTGEGRDAVYKIGDSLGEKMTDALTGGAEAQNKAIGFYKNGPFNIINGMLRGVKGKALKKLLGDFYEEPEMWKTIEGIEAACKKDKIPKGLELWRGLGVRPSAELKLLKAGDTFSDDAFQSFSFDHELADYFAQRTVTDTGYEKTFVRYVADGDMTGARIGSHLDESEILIPRGTEWKITSKTTKTLPDGGIENYYTVTANKATGAGPVKVVETGFDPNDIKTSYKNPDQAEYIENLRNDLSKKVGNFAVKDQENVAIRYYRGAGYETINSGLRGLDGEIPEYLTPMIDQITETIDKNVVPEGLELWRGLGEEAAEKMLNLKAGQSFADDAFQSFSYEYETARFFSKTSRAIDGSNHRVILRTVADGKMTGAHMATDEYEMLLQKGSRWKIVDITSTEVDGVKFDYYTIAIDTDDNLKKILKKADDASWDPSEIDTLGTSKGDRRLRNLEEKVEREMGDALMDNTSAEIESIEMYQDSDGCDLINALLRGGGDISEMGDVIPSIDKACSRNSVPEGLTLWRGLGDSPSQKLFEMGIGDTFADDAYQSFSYGHSIASSFAKKIESIDGYDKKVFLRCIADKDMTGAHLMGDESEILIPRGTKWKIVDIRVVSDDKREVDNCYFTVKRIVEDMNNGVQYSNQQWR